MLKAKIKISQITNLTDARYFAAWGVDYLGFDINPESQHFTSPSTIAEIAEWVEGPEMVLESPVVPDGVFIKDYETVLKDILIEVPVHNSPNLTTFTDPKSGGKIAVFHSTKPWSSISLPSIESLTKDYSLVLVDLPFKTHEVDMILDAGIAGFVLRGGEEEKVGFKSYDDMDELFEYLSD